MLRRVFRVGMYASALVVGGAVASSLLSTPVVGSGVEVTETRPVEAVTEVELAGGGELVVTPSDRPGLTVTADDNLLPYLETVVSRNRLSLRTRSGYRLSPVTPVVYRLSVPRLSKLTVSGSGAAGGEGLTGGDLEVRVTGSGGVVLGGLDVGAVKLTVTGSGTAELGGRAASLTAKVTGSGEVKAGGLKVGTAEATVTGSGGLTVWPADALKARVTGSGDVRYKGTPTVERKVTGSGSVRPVGG